MTVSQTWIFVQIPDELTRIFPSVFMSSLLAPTSKYGNDFFKTGLRNYFSKGRNQEKDVRQAWITQMGFGHEQKRPLVYTTHATRNRKTYDQRKHT